MKLELSPKLRRGWRYSSFLFISGFLVNYTVTPHHEQLFLSLTPLSLYTSLTAPFVLIPELVPWALSPLYTQIRDLFWVIHDFYNLFIFYKFVFIRSA